MERGPFNVSEDCAQAAARDGSSLIRPNHHDRPGAFIAPCFDGSVAPSDDENALRFNRDFCSLLSRHRQFQTLFVGRARSSFFVRALRLMDDDAEAEGVVMTGLACEGDGVERPGNAPGLTVSREHRIVVKLEDANINSSTGADV